MSGLEKFDGENDGWRSKLANFLMAERIPDTSKDQIENTDRFSLDIADNLLKGQNSETETHMKLQKQQVTNAKHAYEEEEDESFVLFEKMCNKTVSDPDSTLFKYVHGRKKMSGMVETMSMTNTPNENMKVSEMTLLENIEAPSAFWENSIVDETPTFQTSPVKMVGLLRPSTIIEEGCNESGEMEFHSQHTTSQQALSTATSMTYETANDFTSTSGSNMFVNGTRQEELPVVDLNSSIIDVDAEEFVEIVEEICSENYEIMDDKNKSVQGPSNSEDSIIFDKTVNEVNCLIEKAVENPKIFVQPNYSMISDTSMSDLALITSTVQSIEEKVSKTSDTSLGFDGTLEKVEYMLRKGMEFMAQNNLHKDVVTSVEKDKLFSSMPLQDKTHSVVNTPRSNRNDTPLKNEFAINMKPIPKFEVFKKPSTKPSNMREKKPHPNQFAHIVSPVGAYMKRTPVTPLIATVKSNVGTNREQKSAAFRNRCLESGSYQPKFILSPSKSNDTNFERTVQGVPTQARSLPKKAYISAEFKHIVDERTKITIPGGDSLRQYIEPALLPSVVRHEGRLKVAQQNYQSPRKTNLDPEASVADLSVMSGDVSVYTLMDAQKFKMGGDKSNGRKNLMSMNAAYK